MHDIEVAQLMGAQHDFGRNIEIRHFVGFGNKRRGARCPGIGFDHVYLVVFNGKLDIDQTLDIQGAGNFFGVLGHGLHHNGAERIVRQYGR